MSFVIDTAVPLQKAARGRKPTEFPLTELEVGYSFLIPIELEEGAVPPKKIESWRRKLRVAIDRFEEQYGKDYKFSTAVVNDEVRGVGLRVYRTQ